MKPDEISAHGPRPKTSSAPTSSYRLGVRYPFVITSLALLCTVAIISRTIFVWRAVPVLHRELHSPVGVENKNIWPLFSNGGSDQNTISAAREWVPPELEDEIPARPISSRALPTQHARVFIWTPAGQCTGDFTSGAAKHSKSGFPYAVIRDAVVDRRVMSINHVREIHADKIGMPFVRIVLYLTVHLSSKLSAQNAVVNLVTSSGRGMPVTATVDYVTRVDSFLIHFNTYTPGKRNSKMREVSEWQMGITIFPEDSQTGLTMQEFAELLVKASTADDPALLKLNMSISHFDNTVIPFSPHMRLACVVGWLHDAHYPPIPRLMRSSKCLRSLKDADGAVVLSGSSLYGSKNREPKYFREVAQFAARALYGPIKFNTVVMSVIVNETIGGIAYRCGTNETCRTDLSAKNRVQLEEIRKVVEEEFDILEVPRMRAPQVILVPACRLGSHAWGSTEQNAPCGACHMFGQYHSTFFAYAMVGAFYKWAMSYDMDEILLDDPRRDVWNTRSGNASDVFDGEDKRRSGYLTFQWLHFLNNDNVSRIVTSEIMRGFAPRLKATSGSTKSLTDLLVSKDPTGKCAVRCDVGLGFTIHASIIKKPSTDPNAYDGMQVHNIVRGMRMWHARLHYSRINLSSVYIDR